MTSEEPFWYIPEYLCEVAHTRLLTPRPDPPLPQWIAALRRRPPRRRGPLMRPRVPPRVRSSVPRLPQRPEIGSFAAAADTTRYTLLARRRQYRSEPVQSRFGFSRSRNTLCPPPPARPVPRIHFTSCRKVTAHVDHVADAVVNDHHVSAAPPVRESPMSSGWFALSGRSGETIPSGVNTCPLANAAGLEAHARRRQPREQIAVMPVKARLDQPQVIPRRIVVPVSVHRRAR